MSRLGLLCLVALGGVLVLPSSIDLHARQARSAARGVYTDAQAKRGEGLSQTRCIACHGENLSGDIAPPLVGQDFLSVWDKQPLSALFDKIHNTMPADAVGSLTRTQSADLTAYILRANGFPPGMTELGSDDATLKQISLARPATAAAAPASAPAAGMSFPAAGNLNQVMRGILFPSSNVLFDVQTQDPGARQKGARPEAVTTTDRYGDVYDPWMVVDAAAISLVESAQLLMTPGRRCENGKPVPIDGTDWRKYVQDLADVGRAAYKAAQTRSQAAVSEVTNQVSEACANCHRVYRDTGTAVMRCLGQ
jgi:mono/diheme cytochrome c family protein